MVNYTDEKKLVIEIISTLANYKDEMIAKILKPANIPEQVYLPLLRMKNGYGKKLSKREMAPKIIDWIEKSPDCNTIIHSIIKIAANWNYFYLANNEYEARATVQKAKEVLIKIENRKQDEKVRLFEAEKKEKARKENEKKRQLELLLSMFDGLIQLKDDPQKRGYLLEELFRQLFEIYNLPVIKSFRRNKNGEQIDGAFILNGWHYIVEIKWKSKLANIRDLDGLYGQVNRSGKQTMGLFLSIEGWSGNVPSLLKQNPDKSIFLMDGYDLRTVLVGEINLIDLLQVKIAKLNLDTEPYYSVSEMIR